MKKQVISFLALFGLVLVLSVYYVLLPTNLFIQTNGEIKDPNIVNVDFTIDESSNLYFATLDSKLEEKHNNVIYDFESVVASQTYDNEDKEQALNKLNYEYRIINSEKEIVSLIKESGYQNAYVEYLDSMIKVIVQSENLTNVQAAEIVSIVIDNSINGLLPEVTYVK